MPDANADENLRAKRLDSMCHGVLKGHSECPRLIRSVTYFRTSSGRPCNGIS